MPKAKLITDVNNNFFSNNKLTLGSSQPTAGSYNTGDVVISNSPNNSAYGWICTSSGTPGSWKVLKSAVDISSMDWNSISGKPSTFQPTIGTTSTTAFRGDQGLVAYNHSQSAHAPSNAQKNSDITKPEIEAKLTGDITTHTHSAYALVNHGTHVPTTESANNSRFLRNDNSWQTVTAENIGAGVSKPLPTYGEPVTYVKICDFDDAGSGNTHAEALISGSGNFGGTEHMIAILRVSGRADRKVQLIKLAEETAVNSVEIGYTRSGTTTTVWLKRPSYDGGGSILILNTQSVRFPSSFTAQESIPSGYTTGSNIAAYQYPKVSPTLANNIPIKGLTSGGSEYDIMRVDTNNNIALGWGNQTYINVNNTMRIYRDVHMQSGTGLYAIGLRVNSGSDWSSIGLGSNHVRLEYAKNDCVYIAGSETISGGYHLPFRAHHFESVANYIKVGAYNLTVGSSASPANVGDIWIQN